MGDDVYGTETLLATKVVKYSTVSRNLLSKEQILNDDKLFKFKRKRLKTRNYQSNPARCSASADMDAKFNDHLPDRLDLEAFLMQLEHTGRHDPMNLREMLDTNFSVKKKLLSSLVSPKQLRPDQVASRGRSDGSDGPQRMAFRPEQVNDNASRSYSGLVECPSNLSRSLAGDLTNLSPSRDTRKNTYSVQMPQNVSAGVTATLHESQQNSDDDLMREAMEVSNMLSRTGLSPVRGVGYSRGLATLGNETEDVGEDHVSAKASRRSSFFTSGKEQTLSIEADFAADDLAEVAGGALRKSYEKYDEILIFSHYIETLFVPVDAELAAFLVRYASLPLFCRFSKPGPRGSITQAKPVSKTVSGAGTPALSLSRQSSLLDCTMTSQDFEDLLRNAGDESGKWEGKFKDKDTRDFDSFQRMMVELFEAVRDKWREDGRSSPLAKRNDRTRGGAGGGGEFPWEMRKVGGGYKKVLIVPEEARNGVCHGAAQGLRRCAEEILHQMRIVINHLLRERALCRKLEYSLGKEKASRSEFEQASATAEREANVVREKLTILQRVWEDASAQREIEHGEWARERTNAENRRLEMEDEARRGEAELREGEKALRREVVKCDMLVAETDTLRSQMSAMSVELGQSRSKCADLEKLVSESKAVSSALHSSNQILEHALQQEKVSRGIVEEEVTRLHLDLSQRADDDRRRREEEREQREQREERNMLQEHERERQREEEREAWETSRMAAWEWERKRQVLVCQMENLLGQIVTDLQIAMAAHEQHQREQNRLLSAQANECASVALQLHTIKTASARGLAELNRNLETAHMLLSEVHYDASLLMEVHWRSESNVQRLDKALGETRAREEMLLTQEEAREQEVNALRLRIEQMEQKLSEHEHRAEASRREYVCSAEKAAEAMLAHAEENQRQIDALQEERTRDVEELGAQVMEGERIRRALEAEVELVRDSLSKEKSKSLKLGADLTNVLSREAVLAAKYTAEVEKHRHRDDTEMVRERMWTQECEQVGYDVKCINSTMGRLEETVEQLQVKVLEAESMRREGFVQYEQLRKDNTTLARHLKQHKAKAQETAAHEKARLRELEGERERERDRDQRREREHEKERNEMRSEALHLSTKVMRAEEEAQSAIMREQDAKIRIQEKEREVMNLEVELEAMKAAEISLKQEAKHLQQELARTKAALSARDLQFKTDLRAFHTRIASLQASPSRDEDASARGRSDTASPWKTDKGDGTEEGVQAQGERLCKSLKDILLQEKGAGGDWASLSVSKEQERQDWNPAAQRLARICPSHAENQPSPSDPPHPAPRATPARAESEAHLAMSSHSHDTLALSSCTRAISSSPPALARASRGMASPEGIHFKESPVALIHSSTRKAGGRLVDVGAAQERDKVDKVFAEWKIRDAEELGPSHRHERGWVAEQGREREAGGSRKTESIIEESERLKDRILAAKTRLFKPGTDLLGGGIGRDGDAKEAGQIDSSEVEDGQEGSELAPRSIAKISALSLKIRKRGVHLDQDSYRMRNQARAEEVVGTALGRQEKRERELYELERQLQSGGSGHTLHIGLL